MKKLYSQYLVQELNSILTIHAEVLSMPPGTRSPRSKAIPRLAIEQAESFLQELPKREKENLSVSEAITGMTDTVRVALAKGYSYNEISDMLSDKLGISVSAWSLRRYIPAGTGRGKRSKAADAAVAPKRGRKKKDSTADLNGSTPAMAQTIATPSQTVEAAPVNNAVPTVDSSSNSEAKTNRRRTTTADQTAAEPEKPAATSRRTRGQTAAKKPSTTRAKSGTRSSRKK